MSNKRHEPHVGHKHQLANESRDQAQRESTPVTYQTVDMDAARAWVAEHGRAARRVR